jgi:methyl-accepting chemotaxis protein
MHIFFKPAMFLLNRLTYRKKFFLLSIVLLIPIAVTMFLLISELDKSINFTEKERRGNEYLIPLKNLSANVQTHRRLTDSVNRDNLLNNQLSAVQVMIDDSLKQIDSLDQSPNGMFQIGTHTKQLN